MPILLAKKNRKNQEETPIFLHRMSIVDDWSVHMDKSLLFDENFDTTIVFFSLGYKKKKNVEKFGMHNAMKQIFASTNQSIMFIWKKKFGIFINQWQFDFTPFQKIW